ncbi:CDGP domain-containing protein [Mycobacteroides chelonae]|uniref:CDGP domain-containing protein n=1 Tax=Mycobacteroides chelonae TaxID=1774 RepID=UPI0009BFAD44
MRIIAALPGTVIAAGLIVVTATAAEAVPGDPMPGCETQVFATYCDGPIRPDGSWKRCLLASGQSGGPGVYVPPVRNCFVVPAADQIAPTPLGQPGYHID